MNNRLKDTLDSIFSLLPKQKAEQAKRELLEQVDGKFVTEADELKWAEFDPNGRFLGGGITTVSELNTRVITKAGQDSDIADLVRHVSAGGVEPGTLDWIAETNRLHWFVPFLPSRADKVLGKRLRGLSMTFPLFREILRLFNPQLTVKEWRVVFQIVAGISLRDAAIDDSVSYETKRAHVKSACEKLNCSSQRELTQKVIGQMTYLVSISDAQADRAGTAEAFVSRYLADDVCLREHRLPDERLVRYLECGPSDGIPVVVFHSIMFALALRGLSPHLDKAGIRLITPIRQGFLDSGSVSSLMRSDDLIDTSMDDIADLIDHVCDGPIVVLGHSLGAMLAVNFANRHPGRVSELVLLSTNLAHTRSAGGKSVNGFRSGLKDILDHPDLFRSVNWCFRKYYADEATCRTVLLRMFGDSTSDRDVLEGKLSKVPAYAMFSETYQTSIVGIAEDFRFGTRSLAEAFSQVSIPVTFVHGDEDPLTNLAELGEIVDPETSAHRIIEVLGGGHFISVSHPGPVWHEVGNVARAAATAHK